LSVATPTSEVLPHQVLEYREVGAIPYGTSPSLVLIHRSVRTAAEACFRGLARSQPLHQGCLALIAPNRLWACFAPRRRHPALLLHLQRFQSAHDRNPQFLCAHEGGALRVSLGLSQEAPGEKGPACFL